MVLALRWVFCTDLRTDSDLCFIHHLLIGFYNRGGKCLQRGTDWFLIWSRLRFVCKRLTVPKVSVSQQTERASPTFLTELHRINLKVDGRCFILAPDDVKCLCVCVCVGMSENVASSRCMYKTSAYFYHWNTCGWPESFVNLVKYGTWDLFMERCGQPHAMQKGITSTEIKQTNKPPTCSFNSILM